MSDATPIPNFGQLLGPFIARVPEPQRPRFLAMLERRAAGRYRTWAEQARDSRERYGLLDCAAREDEIATRVEALFPGVASDDDVLREQLPGAARTYLDVFAGLPKREQYRIQASAERQGAAAWRGIASQLEDPEMAAGLEGCAQLEEESARYLERLLEPGIPAWRRPIDRFASSRPVSALLSRIAPLIDTPLMRLSRGRLATTFGMPTLLLTTTGRKSGEPRSTPLIYHQVGPDLAVIGTRFGSTQHPAWYLNLHERPEATVLLDGDEYRVRAREAQDEEWDRIWAQATRLYGGYEEYSKRVGSRRVPILILSRQPDDATT